MMVNGRLDEISISDFLAAIWHFYKIQHDGASVVMCID